ncbi:probable G-protein coupled receptor 156 [Pelobates fuscus]|uniref:probable G-protein coupled receptor 156 n=1 Tax=Pelobates fuscus TaxID=191477 RepID=UPI002FE45822
MESALNCSELLAESHVASTLDREEALWVLQEVCRAFKPLERVPISTAALGVSGSLLTCGLLLSIFFFIFTLRFRGNRIVKMSSPNLNLVILVGSALSYISAFLFVVQEPAVSMETIVQVRISLLYVGLTLIFGPLLGKSWRLHRVFSHRVPDKRVIIKDLTLLALVGLLLFVDSVLLLIWVLSDPVLCVRTASATIRSADRGTSCAVTRINICASVYTDLWIGILGGFKGALVIYGSYLAGLTNNISSPPVNQSLAIMVGTALVVLGTGIVFLISHYFHTWPNLVYGVTSGSILVCTTTITCLIFIPQILQWRQFEEEQSQSTVQMAKYFNSPSRSFRSMYSEEQIYQLLGENTSMRRLLSEKNAVIESLQEQVSSAKEKLVKLLNSEVSFETMEAGIVSAPPASTLTHQHIDISTSEPTNNTTTTIGKGEHQSHEAEIEKSTDVSTEKHTDVSLDPMKVKHELECNDPVPSGCSSTPHGLPSNSKDINIINKMSHQCHSPERQGQSTHEDWEHLSRHINYVSSDKLQEILKELSIETLPIFACQSPKRQRRASHSIHMDTPAHSSGRLQKGSVSLSPSLVRSRRGNGYIPQNRHPSFHFTSSVPPSAGYLLDKCSKNRFNGVRRIRDERQVMVGHSKAEDHTSYPAYINTLSKTQTTELGDQVEDEQKTKDNKGVLTTKSLRPVPDCSSRSVPVRRSSPLGQEAYGLGTFAEIQSQTYFTETDSSSSEETFCYCHRPYCELCFPTTYDSSDSCNSETETTEQLFGWSQQPVVNFKEDLKPTLV